jgi:rhamnosyltransferase
MTHYPQNISIVIPVKNGIKTVGKLIDAINNQRNIGLVQIIVIDSGSKDGTIEYLCTKQIDLAQIHENSFNHGGTRNLGVSLAKYDLIQFTVQDACPIDEFWLYQMSSHFKDPVCDAVSGAQIVLPGEGVNPHAVYRPVDVPSFSVVYFENVRCFHELSPNAQRSFSGIDNVNTMYRKSALVDLQFEIIDFGEDMLWAKKALESGRKIIYDKRICVEHYHFEFPDFVYKRTLIELLYKYRVFGISHFDKYQLHEYLLIIYRNCINGYSWKWVFHNWRIVYHTNKAINCFNSELKKSSLDVLFDNFKLNIPIGKV